MFSLGPCLCLCLCINPRVLPPGHPQPQGSPQHVRPSASSFLGGGAGMFFLSFPLPNTPIFLSATRQHGQGRRLRVRYLPRELLSTRRAAERGAGGQHGSLKCCLSLRALSLRGRGRCGRAGGSKAPWTGPDATLIHRGLKMNRFGQAAHPPCCVITFPRSLIWLRPVIMRVLSNRLEARPRKIPSGDAIGQNNSTCFPLNKSIMLGRSLARP